MVLGNRCRETGAWIWFQKTGVWIWFREIGVRKQVSGNKCLDSFWKQVSGNRCLEINCLETDVFCPLGNLCHWDLPVQSRRETMVLGFGKQESGYGFGKQVSGNRCLIFLGETGVGKQVS